MEFVGSGRAISGVGVRRPNCLGALILQGFSRSGCAYQAVPGGGAARGCRGADIGTRRRSCRGQGGDAVRGSSRANGTALGPSRRGAGASGWRRFRTGCGFRPRPLPPSRVGMRWIEEGRGWRRSGGRWIGVDGSLCREGKGLHGVKMRLNAMKRPLQDPGWRWIEVRGAGWGGRRWRRSGGGRFPGGLSRQPGLERPAAAGAGRGATLEGHRVAGPCRFRRGGWLSTGAGPVGRRGGFSRGLEASER